jgi:hypothetical protein
MDLFTSWRLEERYAKAGYKYDNIRIGHELIRLIPQIREDYNLLEPPGIGVFQLQLNGITCFLIKTAEAITFGTYNDICSSHGGTKMLNEFLKKKYGAS